ncbi:hypothetical protein BDP27DRAFT_1480352 [Rhodocollybia butyracea]|uniref:VWFA domain-containing protein n=1 Tax=Rhodocollybia butyracea TaxID=206335 RepID=A0A9P5PC71_9AGAR|nr:hypothetical protein BDP27DRAFT_1480352 [Rhodocollybia butyracea]
MVPSKDDVAKFITVFPNSSEEKALMFLEGANTFDEAISQYSENPEKSLRSHTQDTKDTFEDPVVDVKLPVYSVESPPPYTPPPAVTRSGPSRSHTNAVIEAGNVRASDEQEIQNMRQMVQRAHGIYNSDIEPEHVTDYICHCDIHAYRKKNITRLGVQEMWSRAVMYPGEKSYNYGYKQTNENPYRYRVVSPYGFDTSANRRPDPRFYAQSLQQIIQLNAELNEQAQIAINAKEPPFNIWELDQLDSSMFHVPITDDAKRQSDDKKQSNEKPTSQQYSPTSPHASSSNLEDSKPSRFGFKRAIAKLTAPKISAQDRGRELRDAILEEENGRWPDQGTQQIAVTYRDKVGMTGQVAHLRAHQPIQYLHLLRAGYFEPIPVAWSTPKSNPLRFRIDASAGWRGITPTWRGFENTAEERLYWVLNRREGSDGAGIKPDIISQMKMARARMATAVESDPIYYSPNDTCRLQQTSDGYSKQVLPTPFGVFDKTEVSADTMILLDVSRSMDSDPIRPDYNGHLIAGYSKIAQPKNNDVAKAIIRRFTEALANRDNSFEGCHLTTFSSQSNYMGLISSQNLDAKWNNIQFGGGAQVMTGWQKVKDLYFRKHPESANKHPVYGWQAGPQTPMLRLLLLLDGGATDMAEFELDLLGHSWVHITILLVGVDGDPHHHRHAMELERLSEVNDHVSFVDVQGNAPERYITHELLKRHLGYNLSMDELLKLEQLPAYTP